MSLSLPFLALAALALQTRSDPPKAAFDLKGARLGMSLEQWRALPYPGSGPGPSRIKTICSADPGAGSTGLQLLADQRTGMIVCAYASQYGRYFLPEPIDLAPKYRTRRLRYYFRQDRLVRIEYHLSVDAFDPLVSDFDARYGPPAKLVRDTVRTGNSRYRRVTQTWKTSGMSIEIVDPVPPAYDLSLSFVAAAPLQATTRSSSQLSARTNAGHT